MPVYKAGPRRHAPTYPGKIIQSGIKAMHVTIPQAAKAMGIEPRDLRAAINGATVTRDLDRRVSRYFGCGSGLLVRMQADCDAWDATATAKSARRAT